MPRPAAADARARVLDAAEALLRGGDDALTMDALAAAAGLSRATVYRRFATRDAVLAALADAGRVPDGADAPDVRDRALDAALRLLATVGPREATMARIADEAGLGIATIYRHFGDRDGLLRAVAEERTPRAAARAALSLDGDDLEGDLLGLARVAVRFMADHQGFIRLALSPDPETRELLAGLRDRQSTTRGALAAWLGRHMAAGRLRDDDPYALAELFFGMIAAVSFLSDAIGDGLAGRDPDADAARIVRVFLDGCRAPPASPPEDSAQQQR